MLMYEQNFLRLTAGFVITADPQIWAPYTFLSSRSRTYPFFEAEL